MGEASAILVSSQGVPEMNHDLTIMIYGAIMGVVGSVLSSIVTALFQLWLARREDEIKINASRDHEETPEGQRKAAEAGSLAISAFVGGLMVYKTHDSMLGFTFSFMLSFLLTQRLTRALRA